jgi:hypothetical protein
LTADSADYTSKQIFSSLAGQRIKDSILKKKRGASREPPPSAKSDEQNYWNFLLAIPRPTSPKLRRSMVDGSGTEKNNVPLILH